MPHIFVIILLIEVVWTAGGSKEVAMKQYPTYEKCQIARKSFFKDMDKFNTGTLANLRDEYDASCLVFTSTMDQPI